jgi:hypothetical protein
VEESQKGSDIHAVLAGKNGPVATERYDFARIRVKDGSNST